MSEELVKALCSINPFFTCPLFIARLLFLQLKLLNLCVTSCVAQEALEVERRKDRQRFRTEGILICQSKYHKNFVTIW